LHFDIFKRGLKRYLINLNFSFKGRPCWRGFRRTSLTRVNIAITRRKTVFDR